MFNLIGEIKKEYNLPFTCEYNLLNISGKALYVEGHEGVIKFSKELMCKANFKILTHHLSIPEKMCLL